MRSHPVGIVGAVFVEQGGDRGTGRFVAKVLRARRDEAVVVELAGLCTHDWIADGGQLCLLLDLADADRVGHAGNDGVIDPLSQAQNRVPPDRDVYAGRGAREGACRTEAGIRQRRCGGRGCRVVQRGRGRVADRVSTQADGRRAGDQGHEHGDVELDLDAAQRDIVDIAIAAAAGRVLPARQQDHHERDVHDPGVGQRVPDDAVPLPAEQRGEELEVGIDRHG